MNNYIEIIITATKENIEIHAGVSKSDESRRSIQKTLKTLKILYSRYWSYCRFKSGQYISNFEEQKFLTLSDPLTSARKLLNFGDTSVEINYSINARKETISLLWGSPTVVVHEETKKQIKLKKKSQKSIPGILKIRTYATTLKIKSTSAY